MWRVMVLVAAIGACAIGAEPACKYKGKARSGKWFGEQYEKFKDRLVLVKGRVYDFGGALCYLKQPADKRPAAVPDSGQRAVGATPPTAGTGTGTGTGWTIDI